MPTQPKYKFFTVLVLVLILKLATALFLTNYYENRYENKYDADIFKYYLDGKALHALAEEDAALFWAVFLGRDDEHAPQTMKNWVAMDAGYMEFMEYDAVQPWVLPQRFPIRINALLCFLTNGKLFYHTLFFVVLGLIGLLGVIQVLPKEKQLFGLIVLGLLPSSLVWTSLMVKETLLLFGIGIALAGWLKCKKRWLCILSVVSGLLLVYVVSQHTFVLVLLSSAIYLAITYWKNYKRYILVAGVLACVLVGLKHQSILNTIASKYNHQQKIGRGGAYFSDLQNERHYYLSSEAFEHYFLENNLLKNINDTVLINTSITLNNYENGKISPNTTNFETETKLRLSVYAPTANSFYETSSLEANVWSFIQFLPHALVIGFLLPVIDFGINSVFFLENLFVLVLIGWIFYRYLKSPTKELNKKALVLAILSFTLMSLLLITYTNPIIGNVVRYKSLGVMGVLLVWVVFNLSNHSNL